MDTHETTPFDLSTEACLAEEAAGLSVWADPVRNQVLVAPAGRSETVPHSIGGGRR